jgi:hypothetical protein
VSGIDLQSMLVGERRRLGVGVAAGVTLLSVVWLAALAALGAGTSAGALGAGTSAGTLDAVFLALFGPIPAAAGGVCGYRYCGYPAAVAAGLAPGVVLAVLVAAVGPLAVVAFEGDTSATVAAGALAGIGFVWSTTGFGIGAVVAVLREVR